MSEYNDLSNMYARARFFPGVGAWPTAFIDFDAEVPGVSTAAAVWLTNDGAGSRASGAARLNRVVGPTVNFSFGGLGSDAPRDAARLQAVRGLIDQLVASVVAPKTATVSGASNTAPITITTTTAHGLTTGNSVSVSGVGGNTAANGTFTITVSGATTFALNGSTGNGAYTSGGSVVYSSPYVYPRDFGLI